MFGRSLILLLLAVSAAPFAHAERIVMFTVGGTIANIDSDGGLLPIPVSLGDALELDYWVDVDPSGPFGVLTLKAMNLTVGTTTFQVPMTGFNSVTISNDATANAGHLDTYMVYAQGTMGSLATELQFITQDMVAGSTHPDLIPDNYSPDQPLDLSLANFGHSVRFTVGTFPNTDFFSADALTMTATPVPPAVPVPAAVWLLGSGLVVLRRFAKSRGAAR